MIRIWRLTPIILQSLPGRPKALPPKVFTETYPRVQYPSSVSKQVDGKSFHSDFGFDIEFALVHLLAGAYGSKLVHSNPKHRNMNYLSEKDSEKWESVIDQELEETVKQMKKVFPPREVKKLVHGETLSSEVGIEGHPDFMVYLPGGEAVILDVKVFHISTGKSEDARKIRIQISSYVALARSSGIKVKKVGIIMPWGRDPKVVLYDVSKWDSEELLSLAKEAMGPARKTEKVAERWKEIYEANPHIGHHKSKGILSFAKKMTVKDRPYQIYLLSNVGRRGEEKSLVKMSQEKAGLVSHLRCYVHAPNNLCLSMKLVSKKFDDAPTIVEAAKNYMLAAKKIGFKGVVFHVDKSPEIEEAYENIRSNLEQLLPHISPECPLLLENPCGDGKGFLSSAQDFAKIVSEQPQDLVGICFDTCHSWGSGYEPMEFISALGRMHSRIGLIHLNGAWKDKGCRADGHYHWKKVQKISEDQLCQVLDYSKKRGLSCIIEKPE